MRKSKVNAGYSFDKNMQKNCKLVLSAASKYQVLRLILISLGFLTRLKLSWCLLPFTISIEVKLNRMSNID